MTTATVTDPHGISALDRAGCGVTLPPGAYSLYRFPGESALAYVKHPDTGELVCIGRDDPGLTVKDDA